MMIDLDRDAYTTALDFLLQKCNRVIAHTGGEDFWYQLPESQRRQLWGKVWDQYPWYSLLMFREKHSVAVDFAALYNAKDEERDKWQMYFRGMWVEMAGSVYLNMIIAREGMAAEKEIVDRRAREVELMWWAVPKGKWQSDLGVGHEGGLPVWKDGPKDSGPSRKIGSLAIDAENRGELHVRKEELEDGRASVGRDGLNSGGDAEKQDLS